MSPRKIVPSTHRIYKPKSEPNNSHISVFVRVRPTNGLERSKSAVTLVECQGLREIVVREKNKNANNKTFTFDRVFGPDSSQMEVYDVVVAPLLAEVMKGYSCTVFAYGQTGTGKTFTMKGERSNKVSGTALSEKDPLAGIVPRAMSQLFEDLHDANVKFSARVSLVELYNEEIIDLLSTNSTIKTLRLYDGSGLPGSPGNVHIQGLEEVSITSKHEAFKIMEQGLQMRKTASTLLNANSSRSHTVFTVTVHMKETTSLNEELVKIGKLHLVDLAGSENISRSGAIEKRAKEAGNINQSLLTLGRVITALAENTSHVPYRESKLTRLLQESLGGRTKTSIIATVSPASISLEETLSTLDYAHRAKNITNRPEVNSQLKPSAMLKDYVEEIERLRRDLSAARAKNGIYLTEEDYNGLIESVESGKQEAIENGRYVKQLEQELREVKIELANSKNVARIKMESLETALSNFVAKLADLEQRNSDLEEDKKGRDLEGANQYILDKDVYESMMSQIESQGRELEEKTKYAKSLEEEISDLKTKLIQSSENNVEELVGIIRANAIATINSSKQMLAATDNHSKNKSYFKD